MLKRLLLYLNEPLNFPGRSSPRSVKCTCDRRWRRSDSRNLSPVVSSACAIDPDIHMENRFPQGLQYAVIIHYILCCSLVALDPGLQYQMISCSGLATWPRVCFHWHRLPCLSSGLHVTSRAIQFDPRVWSRVLLLAIHIRSRSADSLELIVSGCFRIISSTQDTPNKMLSSGPCIAIFSAISCHSFGSTL